MAKELTSIDKVNATKLATMIKKELDLEDVVFITKYAGSIKFALLGYKGCFEGIVEYTAFRGELAFHNYLPIDGIITVRLVKALERVELAYNQQLGD